MFESPKQLSFGLDSEAVRFLRERDAKLRELIDAVGEITLNLKGPPYTALVSSIVSQQISGRAAQSIWQKLLSACGEMQPMRISCMDDEELRAAGLSRPKVAYLRDLTHRVMSKEIDLDALPGLPDDQIVETLVAVHGIGVWTAQMFLIFCLGRPDVFAPKDLGLRAGMKWLYSLPDLPTEKESLPIAEKWRPHRTVASLYLWQAVTRGLTKSAGSGIPQVED